MESSNSVLEVNIKDLRIEDQDFLKEKYKYSKADWRIGMKFNNTQGAVTKTGHRLIGNIANWEPCVSAVN